MDFRDRIAVISGGASGIGAACAEQLRAEGARTVTWDVADGADVYCDTTDEVSVRDAMAWTTENVGVPSLHVAAAGIGGPIGAIYDVPVDGWDQIFAVNVRGVFLTVREVSRAMIAAGLDGAIVTISSVNGVIADPAASAYAATKAAVFHLTRVAALDLGPFNIRVNAVGPGPTATPMLAPIMEADGYRAEVEAATPLGKLGEPAFIADAVVNLMRSDWVTGQALMADGGSSLATARGRWKLNNAYEKLQD